jgi:hypothetical protein
MLSICLSLSYTGYEKGLLRSDALARQVLLSDVIKEAAHLSNTTFTLFDSPRHFPKCRSGWRNDILHRLS